MKNSREEGKLGELRVMNRWWEGVEKKGEAIAGESKGNRDSNESEKLVV